MENLTALLKSLQLARPLQKHEPKILQILVPRKLGQSIVLLQAVRLPDLPFKEVPQQAINFCQKVKETNAHLPADKLILEVRHAETKV